jgi:hypothetical protein
MVYFFDFAYSLQQWQAIGIFDVIIPFMLIFAIVYAILQKTGILGKRPGIDAIVSMAISFIAIINPFVTQGMKIILENTVVAILIVVALMLLLGLVWGAQRPEAWTLIGGIIGIVVFVWIFGRIADYYQMYSPGTVLFSSIWWENNLPWLIPLIFIVIFALVIISSGKDRATVDPNAPAGEKLLDYLFKRKSGW